MPRSNSTATTNTGGDSIQTDNGATKQEKFKCVLCEDELPSKQELQDHFRKHANGKITKKPAQSDKSKISIKQEKDARPGLQNVKCEVCEEVLENVTQAIHHKYKVHPDCQITHFCDYCGKQFPLAICKETHISTEHKIHLDQKIDKKYKCKQCSVEFLSIPAVTFHIQSFHKRVSNILTPVATMPPSKKIKKNNSGEQTSVYYCHLCGMEYIVKFNLQKHLEHFHRSEERNKPAEELVKCSLCDAIFYNKKAYNAHNFAHTPEDLYIESEQDRKQAVFRVDCDFDLSRVPTLWEKMDSRKRPRVKRIVPKESINTGLEGSAQQHLPPSATTDQATQVNSEISQLTTDNQSIKPNQSPSIDGKSTKTAGRNRALVDSDAECRSDTSDESDTESSMSQKKTKKK